MRACMCVCVICSGALPDCQVGKKESKKERKEGTEYTVSKWNETIKQGIKKAVTSVHIMEGCCNIVSCTHLFSSSPSLWQMLPYKCALAHCRSIICSCFQPWYVLVFTPLELMALLLQSFKINPSGHPNTNTHRDTHTYILLMNSWGEVTKGN